MSKFYETVLTLLKADKRFVAEDGTFLRNAVYEAALKMDEHLIEMLLENPETKARFFTEIKGVQVFDKTGFAWVINNRQFLPDSYTRFKNKIGLADADGELISSSGKVELVFPYKDCVLEGGQTKEDQKCDEIFYNETLAPDEVDRLLYPKVFAGAKRYTKDGEEKITSFDENDNLVIKGNNLMAITSLKERYRGKIKLIYIDPPYNTGGDSNIFSYNNTFNHSTWLTFMKNRLEESSKLLRNDGFIVIAIDHSELFYLGVLADSIFGRDNFISIITVQHNPKGRNLSKFFSANSEFLLVYAKSKPDADFQENVVISEDVQVTFTEKDEKGAYRWESYIRARTERSRENRPDNWYPIYVSKDLQTISSDYVEDAYELYPTTNTGDFTWKHIKGTFSELLKESGNFRAIRENGKVTLQYKYRAQEVLKNVWIDKKYQSEFNGTNLLKKLIGKNKFSYPKSLYAVSDIVKIMSGDGDIVLDFFGGSGTTAHAVLFVNKEQNVKRRFILCEQLDEHIDVIKRRLDALKREGLFAPFVYCELAKQNQNFVEEIGVATDADALQGIYKRMLESGFISHKINPKDIEESAADYEALSLEDKKRFLMEILDKNLLYVNYCDIDDQDFKISDADKAFTKNFYKES